MKNKNNHRTRASLLVTTDGVTEKGDATVEFFNKRGHYIGEITIWADGEIWVNTTMGEEFKFKTPLKFFQALRVASKSIISNPTINKTENYTTTNPAGEI
jgi:hypothetical protein